MSRCFTCLMPLNIFPQQKDRCFYCLSSNEVHSTTFRITKIKKAASSSCNRRYNCLVPISGGRDSIYILYYAKNILKLKPLAVHFNNGFVTNEALNNINHAIKYVGADIITYRLNPHFLKKLMKGFFLENGEFCTPCNKAKKFVAYKFAMKNSIDLILQGISYKFDKNHAVENFNEVFDKGETQFFEIIDKFLTKQEIEEYRDYLYQKEWIPENIKTIDILDHISYNFNTVNKVLLNELKWKNPMGQFFHGDCILNPFVNYCLYKKYGYSEKQVFISNYLKYGQIDKEKAKKLLLSEEIKNLPINLIEVLKNYFDISMSQFENCIKKNWG